MFQVKYSFTLNAKWLSVITLIKTNNAFLLNKQEENIFNIWFLPYDQQTQFIQNYNIKSSFFISQGQFQEKDSGVKIYLIPGVHDVFPSVQPPQCLHRRFLISLFSDTRPLSSPSSVTVCLCVSKYAITVSICPSRYLYG